MNQAGTMIVGLTGQTGAGKSTLSRMFAERNIKIIDADAVARDTMEGSKDCLMDLVLEFSTEVIHPDASLNRERLAEICFSDRKKLKRLNEITFPYIIAAIEGKLGKAAAAGERMVVLDAPTLYEAGMDKRCHRVAAVIADQEIRLERIIRRDGMTEEAALRRVTAQNSDGFYTSRADYILTNNGDLDALQFEFLELITKLERMAADGSYLIREDPKEPEEAAPPEPEAPLPEEPETEEPLEDGALEELDGDEIE